MKTRGFTLIEVLIGVALFSILIFGVFTSLQSVLSIEKSSDIYRDMFYHCTNVIESELAGDSYTLPSEYIVNRSTVDLEGGYILKIEIVDSTEKSVCLERFIKN